MTGCVIAARRIFCQPLARPRARPGPPRAGFCWGARPAVSRSWPAIGGRRSAARRVGCSGKGKTASTGSSRPAGTRVPANVVSRSGHAVDRAIPTTPPYAARCHKPAARERGLAEREGGGGAGGGPDIARQGSCGSGRGGSVSSPAWPPPRRCRTADGGRGDETARVARQGPAVRQQQRGVLVAVRWMPRSSH